MRWQRVVLFAAIVAAHVLVVMFFPVGSAPEDASEEQISFATLLMPVTREQQTSRLTQQGPAAGSSRRRARSMRATRSGGTNQTIQDAVVSNNSQSDSTPASAPSINWASEAQIAADNQLRQDGETSRQAAALSQWRSRVMPPSKVPEARHFRWDYARTHRLESSPLGLNINLNDRCSVLISIYLMAIIGGCKLGEIPVHGDLFTHMRDDSGSSAPLGH